MPWFSLFTREPILQRLHGPVVIQSCPRAGTMLVPPLAFARLSTRRRLSSATRRNETTNLKTPGDVPVGIIVLSGHTLYVCHLYYLTIHSYLGTACTCIYFAMTGTGIRICDFRTTCDELDRSHVSELDRSHVSSNCNTYSSLASNRGLSSTLIVLVAPSS